MGETSSMHVVTAGVAVVTLIWLVVLRSRSDAPIRYLGWAAAGCLPWSLAVAGTYRWGLDSAAPVPWMPSVAFTAGAVLLWARGFSSYAWAPGRRLLLLWLGVPAVMLVVRVVAGESVRAPIFAINTVYAFVLLLSAAVFVARRSNDPSPAVRAVVRVVLAGSVGALVAEALRLQLTDTAAVVTIAAVTAVAARHGEEMWPRPPSDALLDDLGALVFVFDHERRLVDLNAPARLFYSLRGAEPPGLGTTAMDVLGTDPSRHDAVTIELDAGTQSARLSGYVQRLPAHSSPSRGWLVLLRRSVHGSAEEGRRDARRAAMGRLSAYDPGTGLVTERAFVHALESAATFPDASEIPAVAVVVVCDAEAQLAAVARVVEAAWATRLETIAIGRYGARGIALVVRDVTRAEVEAWARQVLSDPGVRSAARAGDLASVQLLVDHAAGVVSGEPARRDPGS